MFCKYSKIVVAVMLATLITVLGCASFGAQSYESDDKSIIIYDETITLENDEVYICADNIDESHPWSVGIKNKESDEKYYAKATDCIDNPQVIKTTVGEEYFGSISTSGNIYNDMNFDFATTGGEYRKAIVKLSSLNDYFNEDGSHTMKHYHFTHNYYFTGLEIADGSEVTDDSIITDSIKCWSCLAIVSGGVINFVAPDENGYVDIYVSTDMKYVTSFYTDYKFDGGRFSGGGGGYNGGTLYGLRKGVIDGDSYFVSIKNATKIQRYMAKQATLNSIQTYRADVDNSGVIDIMDATKIQLHIAKYE